MKPTALFVQFEGLSSLDHFDGWRFEGIFTHTDQLAAALTAVRNDIRTTRSKPIKTVACKVVDL